LFQTHLGGEGVQGAVVRVTDATGRLLELQTSRTGNFFSVEPVETPLLAEVEFEGRVIAKQQPVDSGSCNTCHSCGGSLGAKLYPP
jgi:hypothetical protein